MHDNSTVDEKHHVGKSTWSSVLLTGLVALDACAALHATLTRGHSTGSDVSPSDAGSPLLYTPACTHCSVHPQSWPGNCCHLQLCPESCLLLPPTKPQRLHTVVSLPGNSHTSMSAPISASPGGKLPDRLHTATCLIMEPQQSQSDAVLLPKLLGLVLLSVCKRQ